MHVVGVATFKNKKSQGSGLPFEHKCYDCLWKNSAFPYLVDYRID